MSFQDRIAPLPPDGRHANSAMPRRTETVVPPWTSATTSIAHGAHRQPSVRMTEAVSLMLPAGFPGNGDGPQAPVWDMSAAAQRSRSRAGEELRETYNMLFQMQFEGRDSLSPDWWKQQFFEAASGIASSVPDRSSISGVPAPSPTEVSIWAEGKEYTFSCTTNKPVLVGRYLGCDIPLPDVPANSRLAAVLFLFPSKGTMVAADMGGLFGITTLDREQAGRGLEQSLPRDRRALVFGLGEAVKLRLGAVDVMISPKMCVTCMSKPREFRFECGHAVCCQDCVRTLRAMQRMQCPMCRQGVDMRSEQADALDRRPALLSYQLPDALAGQR